MYGCESCIIKKTEHQRTDAFELWCWRRLLIVPWTTKRSNQSILKEINPEYSLKGLMLKLKLQYSGHLIWRADSLERPWFWERLKAGGEGNGRGWDGWMTSLILWAWVWVHGVAKSQTCLSDWTTTMLNLPTRINSMFSVCENLFVSQRCCRFYFI